VPQIRRVRETIWGIDNKVHPYLENTAHAAQSLIRTITHEERSLLALRDEEKKAWMILERMEALSREGKRADWWQAQDDLGMLQLQIDQFEQALTDHRFSASILAGSLLQISKQGISVVHRDLPSCPDGRLIGDQPLKTVIWQGRNQCMHFEEGRYSPAVAACFASIERTFGAHFSLAQPVNLALEVVKLLGWDTYEQYFSDLTSLLG
jgi:hypothetical protein